MYLFNTTSCDKIVSDFLGTPVSSTNKTDRHYITKLLLKVVLNTITQEWNETSTFHTTNFVTNECIWLIFVVCTYILLMKRRILTMYCTQWHRGESATIPSYTIDKEVQVRKYTHYVHDLVSCMILSINVKVDFSANISWIGDCFFVI